LPKQNYLLDACAVLAFLDDETGADIVCDLLDRAKKGEISLSMNSANLIEVYYDRIRVVGSEKADEVIKDIQNTFPINIIENLSSEIVHEAAYLKTTGELSFADSILIATAKCYGATVVTCDHGELKPIEQKGDIPFLWIRPKTQRFNELILLLSSIL
jgi:predicted nucleic acid-binding protein